MTTTPDDNPSAFSTFEDAVERPEVKQAMETYSRWEALQPVLAAHQHYRNRPAAVTSATGVASGATLRPR